MINGQKNLLTVIYLTNKGRITFISQHFFRLLKKLSDSSVFSNDYSASTNTAMP